MRLVKAHIELAKAELAVAGRELGIIIALGVGALVLAILILVLLYVGTFLFLGEWLFGSMGWGIIHGTLLTSAVIGAIAVSLAGGQLRAYGQGFLVGLVVAILLSLLFASNLLRDWAVFGGQEVEDAIALHPNLLPTVVGLVVGAVIVAIAAWLAGWRSGWRFGSPVVLIVAGLIGGGFVGAIVASTVFDNPGAVAISITIGLLTWLIVGFALVARRGLDPAARYGKLIPRESIAAAEGTRDFLKEELDRQKSRMMGR